MSSEQPPRFDEPPTTGEQPGNSTLAHPLHQSAKASTHLSRERMLTVDELSQLDDLSARTLYSSEIKRIPIMPRDSQPPVIDAARNGDTEAKYALFKNCLNWVFKRAVGIYQDYEPSHTSLDDLIQHGNLMMLEYLPRALTKNDPISYLMTVAASEMRRYIIYEDPMIRRSHDRPIRDQNLITVSGEAGWDEGMRPLFDTLRMDTQLPAPETVNRPLYDALGTLSEAQQRSVTTFFGLSDEPAGTAMDIAGRLGLHEKTVERHIREAKVVLAQQLAGHVALSEPAE